MPRARSEAPLASALSQAEALLRAGHAAEALTIYRTCLAAEPGNTDARYFGGIAALQSGDGEQAVEWLAAAAGALPSRADVANNLGAAYRETGRFDQAAEAFRRAATLDPNGADAHFNLGDTLRDLHRPEDAAAAYRAAIQADPACLDAYINFGVLLSGQRQHAAAAEMFKHALDLDPNRAAVHNNLGTALLMTGDLDGAAAAYRNAVACRPDYAEAHASLGATLKELKRYPEAIEAFRHALRLHPDFPAARRGLGDTYLSRGDLENAERTYRQALDSQSGDAGLYDSLGDVLQRQGRHDEAAAIYRKVLEIDPHNPTALHFTAALQGKTTDAPPPDYVRDLFDDFAPRFEQTLIQDLGYDVPNLMRKTLEALHNGKAAPATFDRALDLGCGTGLGGGALKGMIGHLTGVDISANMIAEARAKNLYDSLQTAEILTYLRDGEAEAAFDLIFAADVFVYTGDLAPLFAAVRARLTSGGLFAFSVESLESGTYALQPTGRYAHHGGYVESLANKTRFAVLDGQDIVVRRDRGRPIAGRLYILISN